MDARRVELRETLGNVNVEESKRCGACGCACAATSLADVHLIHQKLNISQLLMEPL